MKSLEAIGVIFLAGCISLTSFDAKGLTTLQTMARLLKDCPGLLRVSVDPTLKAFVERFPTEIWKDLADHYSTEPSGAWGFVKERRNIQFSL